MSTMTKSMCLAILAILGTRGMTSRAVDIDAAALYRFEEASDTIAAGQFITDSSGNERHAEVLFGDRIDIVDSQAGFGRAGSFNGSIAGVDIEDVDTSGDFTFALWMKSGSLSQTQKYLVARGTGVGGLQMAIIYQYEVNAVELFAGAVDVRSGSQLSVPDMDWHHIVYTRTGANLDAYLDGQRKDIKDIADSIPNPPYLTIGGADPLRDGGGVNLYEGLLDDVLVMTHGVTQSDVDFIMGGFLSENASGPSPTVDASDISRDAELSWDAGIYAVTHDVYLGTVFDDVNDASRANPMGVLLSPGQTGITCDPGRLEFGQRYYWRVDEVSAALDNTIFKGAVWNFTVEPLAYPVEDVLASSNTVSTSGQGPERLVDGSGLNAEDQHSTDTADMWSGTPNPDEPSYLLFEFDRVYKLHEMLIWNYNMEFESLLGGGVKTATVEYSEDGIDWSVLGDIELAQAPGIETYTYGAPVAFDGVAARYVRLTIISAFSPTPALYGLSEVRFMYIPAQAREPQPAAGTVDVSVDAALSWRAGREAALHEVYLGTDPDALALVGTSTTSEYTPAGGFDLGATTFWQIVEVNDVEAVPTWASDIWSFSTEEYLVVDDFEAYDDDVEADTTIWQTWIDGISDPSNGGSIVGYTESPFAEQTIVHGGRQSMPLFYDNSGTVPISEATRTFATAQDWSANGIRSLTLSFYGTPDNTGELYLKINDTQIAYQGDPDNIAVNVWHTWNVDLTAINGIENVTSLTLGIAGVNATGQLYIDDIQLSPEETVSEDWGSKLEVSAYEWAPDGFLKTPDDPGYWGSDPEMTKLIDGQIASDYSGGLCAGWNYSTAGGAFGPTLYFDLGSIQNVGAVAIYHQPRYYGFQTVKVSVSSLDNPNRADSADMADWTGEEIYESEYWGIGDSGNAPSVMQIVPIRQEGRWVRLRFLNQEPGYDTAWTMFSEFVFYSE